MATALVIAFDARQTILGGLTNARRGLVIRAWDRAEIRAKARMFVEVRGGQVDLEEVLGARLGVTVQAEATAPDRRKGWIQFNEPGKLAELPVMRAVRKVRAASSQALVQSQSGGGTIRLDLQEAPPDPMAFLADLRAQLVKNRITASLRLDDLSGPLDAWDPPPLILP